MSAEFGRFLYICARARQAKRIVEFGTSFGVSTIYLAVALRDGGDGQLIGTELEFFAAKGYRAVALSLRGHGKSPNSSSPQSCSMLTMSAMFVRLPITCRTPRW